MLLLNFLAKLLNILRSAAKPWQIAAAFSLGMIAGLTPSLAVTLAVFLILIFFNVNFTSGVFAIAIFKGVAYFADPWFHSFGYNILVETPQLTPYLTNLYNMPVVPLTKFNNTVVMGSLISSVILLIPMFFLIRHAIIVYRTKYDEKIMNLKIVRYFKTLKLFQMYTKLRSIGDKIW